MEEKRDKREGKKRKEIAEEVLSSHFLTSKTQSKYGKGQNDIFSWFLRKSIVVILLPLFESNVLLMTTTTTYFISLPTIHLTTGKSRTFTCNAPDLPFDSLKL